jgi:tetratricopeptide (TPR) repeat protein
VLRARSGSPAADESGSDTYARRVRHRKLDRARRKLAKARQLSERGDRRAAEQLLRRFARRRPNDPEAQLSLAGFLNSRHPDQATEAAEAAVLAVRAAELADDKAGVIYRAAYIAFPGDVDASKRLVERVETLLRDPRERAKFAFHNDLLYLQGLIAKHEGDRSRAQALFGLAFEAEPAEKFSGADLALTLMYIEDEQFEDAAEIVRRGLAHSPDSEWLHKIERHLRTKLDPGP